jgi:3-oxoacyl-[acyl-carrier protein] reductase
MWIPVREEENKHDWLSSVQRQGRPGRRGIARHWRGDRTPICVAWKPRGDCVSNAQRCCRNADVGDRGSGGQCIAIAGDITQTEAAQKIVRDTVAQYGRIDILINCAGVSPYRPLSAIDAAFVSAIFDVNVLGTVLVTQAALLHLTSPGGRIINFASALAFRPIPTSSIYAASKAAIVTLTLAFAKELGSKGITVNAVAPGVIETEMTSAIVAERGAAIIAATSLGRIGQPEDIAGIVTFLASPEAGWITGRTILADGGVI